MSTSAALAPALAPVPVPSDSPQRIFAHLPITKLSHCYLDSLGLSKKAQRLADIERLWEWFNASSIPTDRSDTWKQAKFTSMLRTTPYCASRLSRIHNRQFSPFERLIVSQGRGWFTRLNFVMHSAKSTITDSSHASDQSTIRAIRQLIHNLLPGAIDKLGATIDRDLRWNRRDKVLYAGTVDSALLAVLQENCPPGVIVQRRMHRLEEFSSELRAWAASDLPLDDLAQMDMELFLHGIQQVETFGIPVEIAAKFALEYKKAKSGNANLPVTFEDLESSILPNPTLKNPRYVPRSPKTGKPARWVSIAVDANTRPEDLRPEDWIELPPPE
jgi:hypothetical protein